MSIDDRLRTLGGKQLSQAALESVERRLPVPEEWSNILCRYPAAGADISLSEQHDRSGLGVDMQLMDDAQMLDEAFEAYPGIVAVPMGFVPFGMCNLGSGDPYFIRAADGAVVRIPHDAASETTLDTSQIELVAQSLSELLDNATFE